MTSNSDIKKSASPFISRFTSLLSKNIKLVVILFVLLIGSWFVWTRFFGAGEKQSATTTQTSRVEKGTLVISVTSAGQVSATNSRSVKTSVSGVVKTVFVENDETVKSGTKIAEIELDQESQQAYSQALASYQSAKNNLASAQAKINSLQAAAFKANQTFMNGKGSNNNPDTSDPNYIQEKANWLQAEADYKNQASVITQAQTALNSASKSLSLVSPTIYAPISGKISGLSLVNGSVLSTQSGSSEASTGQTIANVITNAGPSITVNLTEVDVTKVKLNNKVTITIDALPNKTYTGKVISIDTVGSVSSGVTSYPAVITFDTDVPEVFSNMSAQASIITETKSGVILVPTSAVQTQNGQSTVRVMRNNQEETVAVETGLSSGTQIEIVSGLHEGDTIVTSAATLVPAQSGGQTTSPFSGMSGPGGGFGGGGAQIRIAR
jgi:membrane fusion protein, macrolide-specific efflux system